MNLNDLLNQITDLGNRIRSQAADLAVQANDPNVSIEDLESRQRALDDMNRRMAALQASYQTQQAAQAQGVQPMANPAPAAAPRRELRDMLKSNEYARAFAYAIRNGINRTNGRGREQVAILYDALTETGGDPTGSDGGFLVPDDLDLTIRELRRALNPLADLFNQETVTAPTGWRILDTAPTTGMSKVNEMATIPTDDQPSFAKVTFSVDKYALIVPASNELMSDNVANLFAYLGRWFAKKQVLTENALLLGALKTLTASALEPTGGTAINGLKAALNKALDPAISAVATIICNQDGFDYLDQLEDNNGRPLLQPDPANSTMFRVLGRSVKLLSNSTMPNITGSPDTSDFFIGDGKEFATLFTRQGFEVASTDIGGNAWKTDSIEVRGICRMGVSKFDSGAMVRRNIEITA